MSPTIEEQLRDEMVEAAGLILPPSELVANVGRRLQRRNRRRGVIMSIAALAVVALVAVVVTAPRSPHSAPARPHTRRTLQPGPQVISPSVVHGPALIDTTTGRVMRAIRTVTLPDGRSPLQSMAAGDILYADSALTDGHDFSLYQRLVRVDGRSGRVAMSAARMRSPTAPYLAFGLVWVGDANRLLGMDPSTLVVRRTVTMPGDLASQIAAAGGYLWVAGWTHLDRVDPQSGQITQIAPTQPDLRYAAVTANGNGSTLLAGIKKLPEITTNLGSLASLNPTTGAVLSSRSHPGISDGIAGFVDGQLWLADRQGGMSGQVDEVDASTLASDHQFNADNEITVAVSDGRPWIGAANLYGRRGQPGALFECANPMTGAVAGQLSLRKYPGRPADALPSTTKTRPFFVAAGPHEIFATVNEDLVIYHADPACAP
jgi:hypothetical protein